MTRKLVVGLGVFAAGYLVITIQPMAAVALLPATGGEPLLWNMIQVLFQALLLIGYVIAARVPANFRRYLLLLAAAATVTVTFAPGVASKTMSAGEAIASVAVSLGPGFIFLCTATITAARVLGGSARDVAWLYAISNAGALCAIVSYSILIQPHVQIGGQLLTWRILAAGLLMSTSVLLFTTPSTPAVTTPASSEELKRGAWWIGGAVPVALSLALTTLLTEELGSHPLVWLGPFGCYLIALVIGFSDWPRLHRYATVLAPTMSFVLVTELSGFIPKIPTLLLAVLHLATLLCIVVWWAAKVRQTMPSETRTPAFLCWLAFGGFSGGLISLFLIYVLNPSLWGLRAGFIYRLFLDWAVPEYLFLIVLSAWLLTRGGKEPSGALRGLVVGGYLTMFAVVIIPTVHLPGAVRVAIFVVAVAAVGRAVRPRMAWAVALAAVLVAKGLNDPERRPLPLEYTRTLMGRIRVEDGAGMRWLRNGDTLHGLQPLECVTGSAAPACQVPKGYYDLAGPIGRVIVSARPEHLRLGVLGLGAGTLAAYLKPQDQGMFFELNPVIVQMASSRFGYLSSARQRGAAVSVEEGDGRVLLRSAPRGGLDMLVIDAFSSDNIPAHLLTSEAVQEYQNALAEDGLLAFHTSSRHFDLSAVTEATSARVGLQTLGVEDMGGLRDERIATTWVFACRSRARLDQLKAHLFGADTGIRELPVTHVNYWTDGRYSFLEALHW